VYGTPLEQPAGAVLTETPVAGPAPILVAFAGPAKQNRLTVAFRLILAIPQLIAFYFVRIIAEILVVIGWFGALFMGRLPAFAADFLTGYVRWQVRLYAYLALLTGSYPPFALEDADYPVRLAAMPGRLNRLAVLFRLILVIPVSIVAGVAALGLYTIGLFIGWLIVLVKGTMPETLFQAIAAVVRYQVRVSGYLLMVTSEYPWGLFGDGAWDGAPYQQGMAPGYGPPPPAAPGYGPPPAEPRYGPPPPAAPGYGPPPAEPGYGPPPPAAPGYGPPPAEPGYGPPPPAAPGYGPPPADPGYGAQAGPGYGSPSAASAYGQPPGSDYGQQGYWPQEASATGFPPAGPASWTLVLSSAARRLVALFIVLGIAVAAGLIVLVVAQASSTVNTAETIAQIQAAHDTLTSATATFGTTTASCGSKADPLSCVTTADKSVSPAFGAFSQTLRGAAMPSPASAAAAGRLASLSAQIQQVFEQLGTSTSISQYQQTVQSSGIQQLLNQFDREYADLGAALNAS
jgi:Domain of unknown function (DUF4389)